MKYKWLNRKYNNKLIVFFNGWGMDESAVNHMSFEDFDVLMFYDYNTLDCDFDFSLINQYLEKYLIAWSMGVMCATNFSQVSYTKKIAINGTLKPIDLEFGINPKIYDLTIRNFNEKSCEKFISNMFKKGQALTIPKNSRTLEDVHNELIALKGYSSNPSFEYNKIIISDEDIIIPTKSQESFWGIPSNINTGHYPFFEFTKWSELI